MVDHTLEVRYIKASEITTKYLLEMGEKLGIPIPDGNDLSNKVLKRHVIGCWLILTFLESVGLNGFTYKNITQGPFGKPYISGMPFFNISHSNDLIIAVFSKKGDVGIDVEFVKTLPWREYEDSFSADEWKVICLSSNPQVKVLELWTTKESILKADGRGLQVSLSSVNLFNEYATIGNEKRKWFYKQVQFQQYACCIASNCFIDTMNITAVLV